MSGSWWQVRFLARMLSESRQRRGRPMEFPSPPSVPVVLRPANRRFQVLLITFRSDPCFDILFFLLLSIYRINPHL